MHFYVLIAFNHLTVVLPRMDISRMLSLFLVYVIIQSLCLRFEKYNNTLQALNEDEVNAGPSWEKQWKFFS